MSDPTRIAQLLASEVDGREEGVFAALSVVDADRDAEPSPGGTPAYGVAAADERFATVVLYPERTVVEGDEDLAHAAGERGLSVGEAGVEVPDGAAVKRAAAALAERATV
ncbi:MAG: hypothetical protein ABEJ68_04185 [Halobacteriaceae archaeon]